MEKTFEEGIFSYLCERSFLHNRCLGVLKKGKTPPVSAKRYPSRLRFRMGKSRSETNAYRSSIAGRAVIRGSSPRVLFYFARSDCDVVAVRCVRLTNFIWMNVFLI